MNASKLPQRKADQPAPALPRGQDNSPLYFLGFCLLLFGLYKNFWEPMSKSEQAGFRVVLVLGAAGLGFCSGLFYWLYASPTAKERLKKEAEIEEIPEQLKTCSPNSAFLGTSEELDIPIFLPDSVRSRHVHILGATGSGKTESVVLPLIAADIERGYPVIICDAKGDKSFLDYLQGLNLGDRLQVFDLANKNSPSRYDPLVSGSHQEAAQRLFNSLTWSEPYYRSKARSYLFKVFRWISERKDNTNPTLSEVAEVFSSVEVLRQAVASSAQDAPFSEQDFRDLSGLRDQLDQLRSGHLSMILQASKPPSEAAPKPSSKGEERTSEQLVTIEEAIRSNKVVYFRLQALLDSETSNIVGRLVINDLAYAAALAHAGTMKQKFCPVFLDEFGSFVCDPFLELIAKARSAGFALHFSHQSTGDLKAINEAFLQRLFDNASVKIVLRIYDPDSSDFMARAFGTRLDTKLTHRVEGSGDDVAVRLEGTMREVHTFRASPSDMKTLQTGTGFVFIAHGEGGPHGAVSVLRLNFPRIKPNEMGKNNEKSNS